MQRPEMRPPSLQGPPRAQSKTLIRRGGLLRCQESKPLCRSTAGPSARPFTALGHVCCPGAHGEPSHAAAPGRDPRREGGASAAVLSPLPAACLTPVPEAGGRSHLCWQMSDTYRAGLWVGRGGSYQLQVLPTYRKPWWFKSDGTK